MQYCNKIEWILLDYLIVPLFFEFGAQDFIGLPLWCACVALAVQWKAVQCGEVQYSAVIVASKTSLYYR